MAESDTVAPTAFAVHRSAWASVCPSLPPEVAAMVAPPVTVSSAPVAQVAERPRRRAGLARSRGNMPRVGPYTR